MKELINPVEDIAKGKDFILRPSGAFYKPNKEGFCYAKL